MAKCDGYYQHGLEFRCYSMMQPKACHCGGDTEKCDLYPERRRKMAELKPCPFCGGKAFIDRFMQPKEEWRIWCLSCTARFGRYAGLSKKDAIEAWNRRAEDGK